MEGNGIGETRITPILPCYEPTDFVKATETMIETMEKIIDRINMVPSSQVKNN